MRSASTSSASSQVQVRIDREVVMDRNTYTRVRAAALPSRTFALEMYAEQVDKSRE